MSTALVTAALLGAWLAATIAVLPPGTAGAAWLALTASWRAGPPGADLAAAVARHPSRPRVCPGLPADGEPLSGEEQRVLGRIEMDSMIIISDVSYGEEAR